MEKPDLMTKAEIEGYIRVPESLSRKGQFAAHAVGNCLSTRPITPIKEGDILIIRPIELSQLNGGEVVVIHTSFGIYSKEYIRKLNNLVCVGFYSPIAMEWRIDESDIHGLYIVDAVMRDGEISKVETIDHPMELAV